MTELSIAARETRRVGSITVTYLPDGYGLLEPAAAFPAWTGAATRLPVSVGSFLIATADRLLLVDLGLGPVAFDVPGFASFSSGALPDSLAAEGHRPADVDTVLFTHLHHDHVGWAEAFTHARYVVAEAEWRHWHGTDSPVGPSPAIQDALAARVEFAADGDEVAPGVRVLAAPGHTPGHLAVEIADGGERLLIIGDALHTRAQVAAPSLCFAFDADPGEAQRTREKLLADDVPFAGGHFTGTVFGR
ncbi:MBL fold hydrolase [Actinorhabdospora filicis]|uniref:MBL fold hydrolase n=1 Tax=Actinorhabdospora filicis TaxID=1785913 RepID=A0A9W6ST72_9ACTN|nr:MBL fold metallo-hydrolase [Actinorhabdospora filicis]GLZ82066.1 MBL fold hydrolase [Actinorhabdospora filicis]